MKLKFMNKMIAIMCAVSISSSCMITSVGAIDQKDIAEQIEAAKALEAAGVNSAEDIEESIALQENFDEINRKKSKNIVEQKEAAKALEAAGANSAKDIEESIALQENFDEINRQKAAVKVQNNFRAFAAKKKVQKMREEADEELGRKLQANADLVAKLQNIFDKHGQKAALKAINEEAKKNIVHDFVEDLFNEEKEEKARQDWDKLAHGLFRLKDRNVREEVLDALGRAKMQEEAFNSLQDIFDKHGQKAALKAINEEAKKNIVHDFVEDLFNEEKENQIVKDFVGNVFGVVLEKANKENKLKQQIARELVEKERLQNEQKENEENVVDVFAEHNEQLIENSKRDIARMNQDAQAKHEYGRPIVENNYNNNNQIVNNQIRNDLMLVNQELNERDNMIEEDYNPDDLLFKPEDAKKKGAGFCQNIFNAGKNLVIGTFNKGKNLAKGTFNAGKFLFNKMGGLFLGNKK